MDLHHVPDNDTASSAAVEVFYVPKLSETGVELDAVKQIGPEVH